MNTWNWCWVLLDDWIVKCNDPLSQFSVKRAVWIIWCWISQLSFYDDILRLNAAMKALQQNLT
jgi:hypothetical protein